MPSSIALVLSKTGGPPFFGSIGYVNDAIAPILSRHGWRPRILRPPPATSAQEGMLPLALMAELVELDGTKPPEVALFDAGAIGVRAPVHGWAKRNMVLYHLLTYNTGTWMTSPDIDLHCANSPYLESSLRAFFAFPNWHARRCFNPQALGRLFNLPLPVPCVEHANGHPDFGYGAAELPTRIQRALDGNVIWGHAMQKGKQDWFATLAVLYWLNELRSASRHDRIALLVPEGTLPPNVRAAYDAMLPEGRACSDYFVEVPLLSQRALFRLVRACRFGLAYNQFPEPFGFYVLESVYNGCPVYTNGVGNNRYLLPPGHGIHVEEALSMAPAADGDHDATAYRPVAERILAGLAAPGDVAAACARGAALIRQQWSLAAFEDGLLAALQRLEDQPTPVPDFEAMRVRLGPFMRALDPESGRFLNDYESGTLAPAALAAVKRLQEQSCRDLSSKEMLALEAEHHLFARGVLTLDA